MKRVRFIAPARREFIAEVVYYNDKDEGLGARFAAAVEAAVARAATFPLAGSPAPKTTRRVFVQNLPFAIVYRPDAYGITVFALAHLSRRPAHWQWRVHDRQQ